MGHGKYPKYLPNVFSEQGVAMMSGVLNSQTVIATPRHSYTMTATKICVPSVLR
jgi:hypothetical protein